MQKARRGCLAGDEGEGVKGRQVLHCAGWLNLLQLAYNQGRPWGIATGQGKGCRPATWSELHQQGCQYFGSCLLPMTSTQCLGSIHDGSLALHAQLSLGAGDAGDVSTCLV